MASSESAPAPRADLRVDVPLVLIPVQVTTQWGEPVTGLKKENFRLFEDDVEQKIMNFSREDAPVSIGLIFDMSASMRDRDKIRKASESAIELLKTANLDDEFFLIEFNNRPRLVVPFTEDIDELQQELAHAKPRGQTALLDAIHLALVQMKDARYLRKALIIVSDGGDNHSHFNETQIKEAMLESDVQVYAMGIFDFSWGRRLSREEREGPRLLSELAQETGGRNFPMREVDDLPAACARIGDALRNQYLLGYAPSNIERDGKYRRVKVAVKVPDAETPLRVRSRLGYHAPSE